MSVPVILRPDAEEDIRLIHQQFEDWRPGAGSRFLHQLREVLAQIEWMPEMFGIIWEDVRAVRLKKYRYVVYYIAFPDRTEVLAVLHGARHESTWQSRA